MTAMTRNTKRPTSAAFAKRMQSIVDDNPTDPEVRHQQADDLMCEMLTSLGYGKGVAIFDAMMKWYA